VVKRTYVEVPVGLSVVGGAPNNTLVVGITGTAGSGKTTAARIMCDRYDFSRVRIAEPIKRMARALGLTHDQVDGPLKDIPLDELCGKTPRYVMQTLGTEWGRRMVGEDIWVRVAEKEIRRLMSNGVSVVVDDVRFPDEASMIKNLGGAVVRIENPVVTQSTAHESERHIFNIEVDYVIVNGGSIADLGLSVEGVVSSLFMGGVT
jgi:hypothetical protein